MENWIRIHKASLQIDEELLLELSDFEYSKGEKICITGLSGSGKSSFLKSLAGFFPIKASEAKLFGFVLDPKNIYNIRKKMGFLAQKPFLGNGNVLEALKLPFSFIQNRDKSFSKSKVLEFLEKLRLKEDIINQNCQNCSGGELQRLSLLRILLLEPQLVLLDEPTTGLDSESKRAMMEVLQNISSSICVSHDEDYISTINKVYEIKNKQLILKGSSNSW